MTLTELVHKFRHDQDDVVEPYLWSDEEIYGYLDEAQMEFCRLVNAIPDEYELTYTASDVNVAIPDYITRIRNGDNDNSEYLAIFNDEEVEDFHTWLEADYGVERWSSDWKNDTGIYPTAIITDINDYSVRLYPIPTQDGSLYFRIFRLPIEEIDENTDELEVTNREWQRIMMYKARSLAYEKHDAETYDSDLAVKLETQFLAKCDQAEQRKRRGRRRSKAITYGGY